MRPRLAALPLVLCLGMVASLPARTTTLAHSLGTTASPITAPQMNWRFAQWNLDQIGAPMAWRYSRGDHATVCVVDTGAEIDHPDLKEAIVGSVDTTDGQADVTDNVGHGTWTASLVAGRGVEITGVAPAAHLLIAKVLKDDGTGSDESVTAGMAWCIARGADVISASIGGNATDYDGMKAIVNIGCKRGVDFAVAAGNDGLSQAVVDPASIHSPCLIAAMATDRKGTLTSFSNYQTNPRSLAIPGQNVIGAWIGGGVAMASGTSMSTPQLAGALALLRSQGADAQEAVNLLLATAHKPPHYHDSDWHTYYGAGLMNVGGAVRTLARLQAQYSTPLRHSL